MICIVGCRSDDVSGPTWENLETTRKNIAREIDDPQRAEQLLALVDSHEIKVAAITDEVELIRQELERKNRDFTSSRAELQTLYDQLYAKLDQVLATIRDDSLEMKQLCSEEEWQGIFAHRKQRFKLFN
jgi:septal ring factor EnvC (AmiA/AmiB activator)